VSREHVISVEARTRLAAQPGTGHNRWHEDVPPLIEVEPGDSVLMDTRDGFDGQLQTGSQAADLLRVSLAANHPLTGPVFVKGAEPGDLLQIDILEVQPDPFEGVGFTAILPGFGLLRETFREPYLVHWRFQGEEYAESDQIPGVRIPCNAFCGIIGVAPDAALRAEIAEREASLAETGAVVALPDPSEAVPGVGRIAQEGLRTIPPRENGGNLDAKQLRAGARAFLPVFVPGALFSAGDLHFSQGDGEVCGSAIEMRGRVRLRFTVRKGEAARSRVRDLQVITAGRERSMNGDEPRRHFMTTGICVEKGRNYSEDLTVAARRAVENMISHLGTWGLDEQQAYVLCSAAADLAVAEAVDLPNVMVSALLPLDIFTGGPIS
jgi:formamidase